MGDNAMSTQIMPIHTHWPHPNRLFITAKRCVYGLFVWAATTCLFMVAWGSLPGQASAESMLYKDYVIRYDRGWDIMCEPYVVQKNDWVLKIFRQKGEIAHSNFKDFLGIFQRLNPHIKNINMIRPGQAIDIPLRKLEHGTLPGQASGVVTIPFVTREKVQDLVRKHAQYYKIRKGDTVSKLIARKYGNYGSKSYNEGVKLFQAANPQVTNLDRIYAGQKIYLPNPEIRDESFYASIPDNAGERSKTPETTAAAPAPVSRGNAAAVPEPAPEPDPGLGTLEQAATAVGGKLSRKGTYYLPRDGQTDFELDLSQHPMMTLPNQNQLLFTRQARIMDTDKTLFEDAWPDIKVVTYDEQSSVTEIVSAIFDSQEEMASATGELGFDDQTVHVSVRAKWVRPQSDDRHLCITPINGPEEQTPVSIRRYLEQNGITLKELLPSGEATAVDPDSPTQRHAVKNVLAINASSQKEFVKSLARTLELTYTPNVSITFPYAGIQVEAYANLIAMGNDREVLVDFGDLYGDAVTALRSTGMAVVQITSDDSYISVVKKILGALEKSFVENPSFMAAKRPAQYNTTITIWGLLYDHTAERRILMAGGKLHPAVTDLLSATGIDVVVW